MTEDVFSIVEPGRSPTVTGSRRLSADSLRLFADGLRIVDIVTVLLAAYGSYLVYIQSHVDSFRSEYGSTALLAAIFLPFVMDKTGSYKVARLDQRAHLCRAAALGCVILFGGLLAIGFITSSLDYVERIWVLLWFVTTVTVMFGARIALAATTRCLKAAGHLRQRIAVIGAGPWGKRLVDHLALLSSQSLEVVGVFDSRQMRASAKYPPPDGTLDDLIALGRAGQIDKIIVALPWSAEHRLLEIIRTVKELSIDIALSPDQIGFSLMNRPVDYVGELPLMRVVDRPLSHWRYVAKLLEDQILAALALLLLVPVMGAVAIAIRLDSPGPILFRQKRHGFNNTEFDVLKFRTMRVERSDALGARQTSRNDGRITRVGAFLRKTSLDELPQLFNVLLGDMSIVGPRPHPIGMRTANRLGEDIIEEYAHRHRVRPGITGWAQVNGYRGATETPAQLQRRVELDLHYIDNWSIMFDVKIVLLTVVAVLSRRNAF
jgi:Undecaprenyl-phosphate glucose phosphotransferase